MPSIKHLRTYRKINHEQEAGKAQENDSASLRGPLPGLDEQQRGETPGPGGARKVNPLDARGMALSLLSILGTVAMLRWAQSVLIPFALGIIISYALSPIVAWIEKFRIPRWISAAILLILLVTGFGTLTYVLGAEGASAMAKLPQSIHKLSESLKKRSAVGGGLLESLRKEAAELEKAVSEATGSQPSQNQAGPKTPVVVERSTFNMRHFLWMGSTSALEWLGEIVLNLFLIYFLLTSGDLFKKKLIKIAGETFSAKKTTIQVLEEINSRIQLFLLVELFTLILGILLSWTVYTLIGLDNAVFWAVTAGVLHTVPYLGAAFVSTVTGLVAFLQFGTLKMGLLVAGSSVAIASFIGMLLMPWLSSRAMRMNAGAVFITLLFWSWIWGIWGMLLGIPITMALKTVCDHVDSLAPIGEMLGE